MGKKFFSEISAAIYPSAMTSMLSSYSEWTGEMAPGMCFCYFWRKPF